MPRSPWPTRQQLILLVQVSKLKQELQNKESNLKSQIAVLSERLQQVLDVALFRGFRAVADDRWE